MKQIIKPLFLVSLSSIFTVSCSQNLDIKKAQSGVDKHSYSAYVRESLQAKAYAPTSKTQPSTASSAKLKAIQAKLSIKQKHAKKQMDSTIQNNGLFKPSLPLIKQLASLKTSQAQEIWLDSHSNLNAALTLALYNNLSIKSKLQEAQAELSKYSQVQQLDDTLATYSAFANKPAKKGFSFPGLLSLKGSIVDQSVEVSRLKLLKTIRDVITQTRSAYYELQYTKQESQLIKKNSDLLRSLKSQLGDSYETQSAELKTLIQVDVNIEKQSNKYQLAQHRQQQQQAKLNALLNISSAYTLKQVSPLSPIKTIRNLSSLIATSKKKNSEVLKLRAELTKIKAVIQLSERRFYPDFSANYSGFKNKALSQTGSNASQPTFSSRPVVGARNFFGNNNAYLTETKRKYTALQTQLQALEKQLEDTIQQTYSQYNAQKSSRTRYQSRIIPKLRTALTIAKNQYETGGSSYLTVIETQNLIITSQQASLEATIKMNKSIAQLEQLTGESIH